MAKAGQVKRALQKAGWELLRHAGSHARLRKGGHVKTFSYHDTDELGETQLRFIAKKFGLTIHELKRLL